MVQAISVITVMVALLCALEGTHGLNVTKVMTFNVLCEVCDVANYGRWRDRLPYLADVLARHQPDIIGFQEPIDENNVEQLQAMIPNHVPLFFNRPRLPSYPDACIFYNPAVRSFSFFTSLLLPSFFFSSFPLFLFFLSFSFVFFLSIFPFCLFFVLFFIFSNSSSRLWSMMSTGSVRRQIVLTPLAGCCHCLVW